MVAGNRFGKNYNRYSKTKINLSLNKTDSILKVDKLLTEEPLDYMYTNFEDTNVITESVICGDIYYMVT